MRVKEALGTAAVETVTNYLKGRGFRVLDRNWTCPAGEIAVVAVDRRTLVACEVRLRAGNRTGAPLEVVSQARKRQLRTAAAAWMAAHGTRFEEVRIDVIGLVQEGAGGFTLEHVRGVE
jgi:putative endonuclease